MNALERLAVADLRKEQCTWHIYEARKEVSMGFEREVGQMSVLYRRTGLSTEEGRGER